MASFLIGLQIAEAIADGLRRACDQLVCGFNGAAACIISDGIWLGVKFVFEQRVFCIADIDSAEIEGSYERTEHIHADLALARAEIADNTARQLRRHPPNPENERRCRQGGN